MIPNARSEYSEHYFREYHSVIPKSTYPIAWSYYNLLPSHWLAIWRIIRRSPLSEENYPNRNPAWKQALLITDFQGNTRKGSSTSLSAHNAPYRGIFCLASLCAKRTREKNEKWTARRRSGALSLQPHNEITTEGSNPSLSAACVNDLFYQSSPEKIS